MDSGLVVGSVVPTFFYTRFGIGVADSSWIDYRLRLFEAVTLPSVSRHLKDGLRWFIFIDEDMENRALTRLQKLVSNINVQLIPVVALAQFPYRLASCMPESGDVRLIRIDDDDAISDDFIAHIPPEPGIYTLPLGYEVELAYRLSRPIQQPFLSLNTVFHGDVNLVREYSRIGHHKIRAWAEQKSIPIQEIRTEGPVYMYSRHKQSDSNFATVHRSIRKDAQTKPFGPHVRAKFGIDEEAYQAWREYSRNAPGTPNESVWRMTSELDNEASRLIRRLYEINSEIRATTSSIFNR